MTTTHYTPMCIFWISGSGQGNKNICSSLVNLKITNYIWWRWLYVWEEDKIWLYSRLGDCHISAVSPGVQEPWSGQWTLAPVSGAEEGESDMKLDTRSGHCHWIPRYEVDTGAAGCFDLHLIGGSHSPEPEVVTGRENRGNILRRFWSNQMWHRIASVFCLLFRYEKSR